MSWQPTALPEALRLRAAFNRLVREFFHARGVLEAVVRHTSGRSRATPLATLACLEWWSGNGARANVLVEQCLEADGAHRLGLTLLHALAAGLAPGWVNAEPAPEDGRQDEPRDEAWGSWW